MHVCLFEDYRKTSPQADTSSPVAVIYSSVFSETRTTLAGDAQWLLLMVCLQQIGPAESDPFSGMLASSWALAKS